MNVIYGAEKLIFITLLFLANLGTFLISPDYFGRSCKINSKMNPSSILTQHNVWCCFFLCDIIS